MTQIRDLTHDPTNRRKHNPRNLGMLADALREVGASRSIVIDEAGEILAGNGVVEAATAVGLTKLQIVDAAGDTLVAVRRSGLTTAQKRALAIYDNRTAELAEWDWDELAQDKAGGLDLEPWWTPQELAAGLPKVTGRTDPDAVPDVRATDIQRGDLFEMGAHRLLCGDCTVAADVARLMCDDRADLVFTSPPYGQQRDYGAEIADWDALMRGAFAHIPASDSTQVLVNLGLIHRDGEWLAYWDAWIAWMRGQGWRRFGWYVWDQGAGLPGDWQGRFAPSHEFVFHFNRIPARPMKHVPKDARSVRDRTGDVTMRGDAPTSVQMVSGAASMQTHKIPDSVIRVYRQCGRVTKDDHHPAVFPVGLPEFVLQSWPGFVYEPFAGSGTTIVAAERLARRCCALEIEPAYCQIAIDRWEAFTGQRAVKVGEAIRA